MLSSPVIVYVCACLPLIAVHSAEFELPQGKLPSLYAHGNHYQIGLAMGTTFASEIADRVDATSELVELEEWSDTDEGRGVVEKMLRTIEDGGYGRYLRELEGISDGSGVGYHKLLLLNLRDELLVLLPNYNTRGKRNKNTGGMKGDHVPMDSCSDYMVRNDSASILLLGHNEDGDVASRNTGFLLTVHLYDPPSTHSVLDAPLRFTSFVYPGELPSGAFGWNDRGIGFSMNGLYPADTNINGVPRAILARHLLGADSLSDAVKRVTPGLGVATGRNYNFVDLTNHQIMGLETAPPALYSYFPLSDATVYFHANSYLRLTNVSQQPAAVISSSRRVERAASLPLPQDEHGVLVVLGDTEGDYPIYRTAKPPDAGYTLVTALFNVAKGYVTLYLQNPLTQGFGGRFPVSLSFL